jgi:cobalt-zinc-cadmium efflux system protein
MEDKPKREKKYRKKRSSDGHHHHSSLDSSTVTKAFAIGIILNLIYVVIQIFIGLRINSLSLLSDAGHNFLDVAGLSMAMIAFRFSKSIATSEYTYGYKKSSILISLANAIILLLSIGAIGYEAFLRLEDPQPIPGKIIAIIAAIGIVINGISGFLFFKDRNKDTNIKSAFLHLISDALVSLGIVIGGVIIYFTHLYWIDPVISIIICFIIIASTWNLLKDSLRMTLDGVPKSVDVVRIKNKILENEIIYSIHHLHIWAISTRENALTVHIVLKENNLKQFEAIRHQLQHDLKRLKIHHTTFQLETEDCKDKC